MCQRLCELSLGGVVADAPPSSAVRTERVEAMTMGTQSGLSASSSSSSKATTTAARPPMVKCKPSKTKSYAKLRWTLGARA